MRVLNRFAAVHQCLDESLGLLATRTEIITELSSYEHAAVKAHQGDPFRVLAGPAERFQCFFAPA